MKVLPIKNNIQAFRGYRQIKDEHGYNKFVFNFPYDSSKYDCYLELYNVKKNDVGNYEVTDMIDNFDTDDGKLKMQSGEPTVVDLKGSYFIKEGSPFAYHYKLVNKYNPSEVHFKLDAGDVVDDRDKYGNAYEVYNVVAGSGSKIARGGSMKLIIPDNYNPKYMYNENNEIIPVNNGRKFDIIKNFSNKIGGNFAGIEYAVKKGDFDGYSNIISLPIFTDDSISAHGYWNKNCMQITSSFGNINNYASLQRAMFAKGINWVSDGAFVNEGLEGIHFSNLLKWGEKSPYYYWFKASGLQNGPFMLGVFGKDTKNISHKTVNAPYLYEQLDNGKIRISRNSLYDRHKPTYVQIFDKSLTSEYNQKDITNTFVEYDKLDELNPYRINTHDDTVMCYKFEINPGTYHKNVKNLIDYNNSHKNKISLYSGIGTRFVNKYEYFSLEDKIESNFQTWGANTDIAQLNYMFSPADIESDKNLSHTEMAKKAVLLQRGAFEASDYVISSGVYWTQKTKDILTLHTAQQFKNIHSAEDYAKKIKDIAGRSIPKSVLENINKVTIKNIVEGEYIPPSKLSDENYDNMILRGLMNFPLDSVELGDNIAGVLASPFITKRASVESEVGTSRFDLYKAGNPNLPREYRRSYLMMQRLYENDMSDFAKNIINEVQDVLFPIKSADETTFYGKYVLPLMTQEIAKFAVIKSLFPDTKVSFNQNGELVYDYKSLKSTSLQSLGIFASSPEDEAISLIAKIQKGIKNISDEDKKILVSALIKTFEGTDETSFLMADAIVDLTQSGLDWRIDAAKDVTDIDALRDGKSDFSYSWQQVKDFWKKFSENVLKVNPNAYLAAEITDEIELYDNCAGELSGISKENIIKQLLNETGMTAVANYSSFFTDLIMMFGKRPEYNSGQMEFDYNNIRELMHKKMFEADYLRSSNLNSLLYSYTFIGNHDKPRILHVFGLDMQQYYADLTLYDGAKRPHEIRDIQNANGAYPKYLIDEYRKRAFRVLNNRFLGEVKDKEVEKFDFSRVSSKAVAMGEVMMHGFSSAMNDLADKNSDFASRKDRIYEDIAQAISTLANGEYLGENFDANAFGVKPFNVNIDAVIEQAKLSKNHLPASEDEIKAIKSMTFDAVLKPALTRLLGAMKVLSVLPGKPTMYHGDDYGETGGEEKTKNIYVQNRGYIHDEWLKDKVLINQFNEHFNEVMSLRKRPELDALNNGAPFVLAKQYCTEGFVTGLLRQNPDGKMAVTLMNLNGLNHNIHKTYAEPTVTLQSIKLDTEIVSNDYRMNEKVGLECGLTPGMKFYNAKDENDEYIVCNENGHYILKHEDNSPIKISDTTFILYYDPSKYNRENDFGYSKQDSKEPVFSGRHHYVTPSKIVSSAYRDVSLL